MNRFCLVLVCACASSDTDRQPVVDPTPTTGEEQPTTGQEQLQTVDTDSYATLAAEISSISTAGPLSLEAAVATCPPPRGTDGRSVNEWYDECQPASTMVHSDDGTHWVGLSTHYGEGGLEGFSLWEYRGDDRELLRGEAEPADLEQLRQIVGAHAQMTPAANVVRAIATTEFSLNTYAPLVELGPPLEGWRLWIEATADLDVPEYVAWLIKGEQRLEVARRTAEVGPCDGDGWWCETGEECDAAGLRAEDRLCVLPLGVGMVSVRGDHLAFLGGVQIAGHGGYPTYHWVMHLPAIERSNSAGSEPE